MQRLYQDRGRTWLVLTALIFASFSFPPPGLSDTIILVSIEPTLTRASNGGLLLDARTNLPDGLEVLVTLQSIKGPLLGQTKSAVSAGKITAGPFTSGGRPHPPGTYVIAISSPLTDLQPPTVRKLIGAHGERLAGANTTHAYGNVMVDFRKNLTVP